ncbi:hypothetical protein HPB52_019782 [Rhipicephalus sanguineus]|uniref:Uncharacterized protein n=1 Tax=Rhipicephalus sanguineus TaxID=34632 RepID=A0A9D4SV17_RHISA|nr:hypothetical protein HPB52_019782 [Rhipicephalus sanguineus]
MPAYSRPATGAPAVEQLSREFPKHPPTTAIIGSSQTTYLHRHFNPYDKATPAFRTIRGVSAFDIESELVNIPRSVTTLVFHVGTSELEMYGPDESLRRLRRLVNNTPRTLQKLQRLIILDARHSNETIKAYCRKLSKVSYVHREFDQLPPRCFLPRMAFLENSAHSVAETSKLPRGGRLNLALPPMYDHYKKISLEHYMHLTSRPTRRQRQQHNTTPKGEACRTTEPRPSTADTNTITANQHGHTAPNASQELGDRTFPATSKACRTHLQPADPSNAIPTPKRRLTSKL